MRGLIAGLLLIGSCQGASCRVGYDEQTLVAGGSGATAAISSGGNGTPSGGNGTPNGGNGTPSGGDASTHAGESPVAGAGDAQFAGNATTGGAGNQAGSPAAGAGGADTTGTPPLCATTADCSCAEMQGHSYWFCKNALKWSNAEARCETQAMHLVRVDSPLENDFLVSTGTQSGVFNLNGFAQIGANDQALAGEWRWVDGTLFWQGGSAGAVVAGSFANWVASSPSTSGVEQCSGILSTGKWQVRSCTAVVPFICEGP